MISTRICSGVPRVPLAPSKGTQGLRQTMLKSRCKERGESCRGLVLSYSVLKATELSAGHFRELFLLEGSRLWNGPVPPQVRSTRILGW